MNQEALEKLLSEKIAEERSKLHTHDYWDMTKYQNGRGAIDGGELFLTCLDTSLKIMEKAVAATLAEVLKK
ncbi:MAG: hypothetical protein MSA77_10045 [Selenomonadales bacterium]|jgi:hypothetical protein|nr:hypothetical protein [Selenomonadales bacterium]MDY3739721.1 hypothetical protein [Selenomonadaceae bacterium]MEE1363006.1 hypothetical protein [Selenomonadaceae bacterium]